MLAAKQYFSLITIAITASPAISFVLNRFSSDVHEKLCSYNLSSLIRQKRFLPSPLCMTASESSASILSRTDSLDPSTLFETDIIIYQILPLNQNSKVNVGCVAGEKIHPLCSWTLESAYSESRPHTIEFLMDEEVEAIPFALDGGNGSGAIVLHVFENIGYGSRQVGGGMGPGNPHGEDSEDLFYVESDNIDEAIKKLYGENDSKVSVDYVVRPDLEFFM